MTNKRKSVNELIVLDSDTEETPKKSIKSEELIPIGLLNDTDDLFQSFMDNVSKTDKLINYLHNPRPCDKYSCGGEAPEMPLAPGLRIIKFGNISLPISSQQAERLINKLHRETPDSSLYEFPHTLIEIENKSWNNKLETLLGTIGNRLNIFSKINAKLQKLILHKSGSKIARTHLDDNHEKVFGTLIIQLPSIYEGGEYVIHDLNNEKTIYNFKQTSNKCQYGVHFVSHFTGTDYEMSELKSGYRLELVYSLFCFDGKSSCMPCSIRTVNDFSEILNDFNKNCCIIGVLLDNTYWGSCIEDSGVKALKSADRNRYNLLKAANSKLNSDEQFKFAITRAALTVRYLDDSFEISSLFGQNLEEPHRRPRELSREKEICDWFDVNGDFYNADIDAEAFTYLIFPSRHKLVTKFDMDKSHTYNLFQNIHNASCEDDVMVVDKFERHVLVLYPKRFEIDAMVKLNVNLAIRFFVKEFDKLLCDERLVENLEKIVQAIEQSTKHLQYSSLSRFMQKLAKFAVNEKFEAVKCIVKRIVNCKSAGRIFMSCIFIQELLKLKENSLALKWFDESLKALIDDEEAFVSIQDEQLDKICFFKCANDRVFGYLNATHELIRLMMIFSSDKVHRYLLKFAEMISKTIEPAYLNEVLGLFKSQFQIYRSFPAILMLFEQRLKWIEEKLKCKPQYSWSIPVSFPEHEELEVFLRSEGKSFEYNGGAKPFGSLINAQRFINENVKLKKNYLLSMKCVDSRGTVKITKNMAYSFIEEQKWNVYIQELDELQKLIR